MSLFVIGSISFCPWNTTAGAAFAAGAVPGSAIAGSLNASAWIETAGTAFVVRFGPPALTGSVAGVPTPAINPADPSYGSTSGQFAYMANFQQGKVPGLIGAPALPLVSVLADSPALPAYTGFVVNILDTNTIRVTLNLAMNAATNIVAVLLSSETPAS
jgi:hypothetical protein